jgi:prepilin-type N-terminal cleavage/methylation domain-containing protein
MQKIQNERGFTLIELVVVIVILSILTVIAVPQYLGMKAEAELRTAKGITASLRGAISISHARYLMDTSNDYDGTAIGGKIETEDLIVAGAASVITATFPSGNTYTWTYTDRSGHTPAKVAEGF